MRILQEECKECRGKNSIWVSVGEVTTAARQQWNSVYERNHTGKAWLK